MTILLTCLFLITLIIGYVVGFIRGARFIHIKLSKELNEIYEKTKEQMNINKNPLE